MDSQETIPATPRALEKSFQEVAELKRRLDLEDQERHEEDVKRAKRAQQPVATPARNGGVTITEVAPTLPQSQEWEWEGQDWDSWGWDNTRTHSWYDNGYTMWKKNSYDVYNPDRTEYYDDQWQFFPNDGNKKNQWNVNTSDQFTWHNSDTWEYFAAEDLDNLDNWESQQRLQRPNTLDNLKHYEASPLLDSDVEMILPQDTKDGGAKGDNEFFTNTGEALAEAPEKMDGVADRMEVQETPTKGNKDGKKPEPKDQETRTSEPSEESNDGTKPKPKDQETQKSDASTKDNKDDAKAEQKDQERPTSEPSEESKNGTKPEQKDQETPTSEPSKESKDGTKPEQKDQEKKRHMRFPRRRKRMAKSRSQKSQVRRRIKMAKSQRTRAQRKPQRRLRSLRRWRRKRKAAHARYMRFFRSVRDGADTPKAIKRMGNKAVGR